MKDRTFWILWGIGVFGFFGLVAGSIYFADSHAGFDTLTGYGLPKIQNAFILNNNGSYSLFYQGRELVLNSNFGLNIPSGSCASLILNVDPITRSVTLRIEPAALTYCSVAQ